MKNKYSRLALKKMVRKYLSGKATPQEEEFLKVYYQYFDNRGDILDQLPVTEKEQLGKEMEVFLMEKLEEEDRLKVRSIIQRIAAAAAILVFMSFGVYFILKPDHEKIAIKGKEKYKKDDISPGGNNAVLTLSDGRKIILNDKENGVLANQGNMIIKKTADGQLIYDLSNMEKSGESSRTAYNTISTPAGGQYQVILPDGSKAWLNAMSSLKFPITFIGNKRSVELTGEGYFEVAKNEKSPFIVSVKDMKIEVLGTHFNVMGYDDEATIKTTLLEGAVRIVNGKEKAIIRPGEQARVGNNIEIGSANTQEAVAWKNGYFIFENEELSSVMRKLSRWYKVDVVYKGDIKPKYFMGKISRYKNISEVLEILKLTESINFKIEGMSNDKERRIIIMP